ncbi:hypothetical protein llap_17207 [Limosa lapponica baueri]|uniref:Uncharacterized protein n=1 Tax=Limosa lapponica baueri TaxID=1758121 RepID=A0A2I0TFB5_LIMLA|nr:hypothetical protein llap_17207 [Limosa lapponica baueri]
MLTLGFRPWSEMNWERAEAERQPPRDNGAVGIHSSPVVLTFGTGAKRYLMFHHESTSQQMPVLWFGAQTGTTANVPIAMGTSRKRNGRTGIGMISAVAQDDKNWKILLYFLRCQNIVAKMALEN